MSTMKKNMRKKLPVERVKCDLLGDVHRLRYEASKKRMVADVLLSPTDVRRLLETLSKFYLKAKTKRGKRICELSAELAELVDNDCSFFAEGTAYVASGDAIELGNDSEWFLRNLPPDIRAELTTPLN